MEYNKASTKINILLYRNPLKVDRETHCIERQTVAEIYEYLELELPIDSYIFLDGDSKILNYNDTPNSDYLYIKAHFTGEGGDLAEEGKGSIWAGVGLLALAAVGILTGGLTWGIAGIAIMGVVAVGSGYYLYTYDLDDSTGVSGGQDKSYNLKGGQNSDRRNQKVPVLFGRHLIYPWYASRPYADYPDANGMAYDGSYALELGAPGNTQYLHMLFGNTYEQVDVYTNTIQIGEAPITTYLNTADGETLGDVISFQEDSSDPIYYPDRVKQEDRNIEIIRGDSEEYVDPIVHEFTTAKDTKSVELGFVCPAGFYSEKDGSQRAYSAFLSIEWKGVTEPDSSYAPFVDTNVGNSDILVMGKQDETVVFTVHRTFDNNTSSDPDYNVSRQYSIRVSRKQYDDNDSRFEDSSVVRRSSIYLNYLRSYVGTFDGVNPPETWPILPAEKAKLNTTSLSIKATDQLNGVISNLNYEIHAHMPVYTGTVSSQTGPSHWVTGVSRNPASAFLMALTNPYLNPEPIAVADLENRIDYASLEEWYGFCADLGLECNALIVNDSTLEQVLKNICTTGFASWNVVDNKYTIYIDTTNNNVIQMFTPRNSWDFSITKAFNDKPTCMAVKFVNSYIDGGSSTDKLSEGGFTEETRYVYYDSYEGDPRSTDIVNDITLWGACSPTQAWRMGKYALAVTRLRPEVFKFNVDIEHIMCTRWDRIKVQHDVALYGITSLRVVEPIESGGNTIGFTSDEIIPYEAGESYGVQIRWEDGSITSHAINNPGGDSREVTFTSPISGTGILFEDDLVAFGEAGSETVDLIITDIEALDNESATLTCVNYDEGIYTAYQSGTIPPFNSRISNGGGGTGAITVNTLPESQSDVNAKNRAIVDSASKVDYRAIVTTSTGSAVNAEISAYPDAYTDDNGISHVCYVDYSDNNYIYSTTIGNDPNYTQLTTVPARNPKWYNNGDDILYISGVNNDLYLKDANTLSNGSAIYSTTNNVVDYAINPANGNIFIVTYTFIQELDASDSYAVIGSYTPDVIDLVITVNQDVFYIKASDGFIYKNNITFTDETLFYDGSPVLQIHYEGGIVYFIKSLTSMVYKKESSNTNTSSDESLGFPSSTTGTFTILDGDLIYSNSADGSLILTGTSNVLYQPTLEGEQFKYSFTGDVTNGSDIITDVDNEDIDVLSEGDKIYGSGIPTNTIILDRGNGEIVISKTATATVTGASLEAIGSRIVLNANKVIVPGSIEARLLSASAIDSKERATNGEKITEIDLDSGTMVYRNNVGEVVMAFNPNNIGNEMIIDGTITAAEFALLADNSALLNGKAESALNVNSATTAATANNALDVADNIITTAKIQGGTLSLQSDTPDPVNDGWRINEDGNSVFNNLIARGTVQSKTSSPLSDGWVIDQDGSAIFNDIFARGTLSSITSDPEVDGWVIDQDGSAIFNDIAARGSMESATSDPETDGWVIGSAGDAIFNSVRVRGFAFPATGNVYNVYVVSSPTADNEYASISEALEDISLSPLNFKDGGNRVQINVNPAVTITSQITIDSLNLGYIEIVSTGGTLNANLSDSYVFYIKNGAVSPKLNFTLTKTGGIVETALYCEGATLNYGNLVISGFSYGIDIRDGGTAIGEDLTCSALKNALVVGRNSVMFGMDVVLSTSGDVSVSSVPYTCLVAFDGKITCNTLNISSDRYGLGILSNAVVYCHGAVDIVVTPNTTNLWGVAVQDGGAWYCNGITNISISGGSEEASWSGVSVANGSQIVCEILVLTGPGYPTSVGRQGLFLSESTGYIEDLTSSGFYTGCLVERSSTLNSRNSNITDCHTGYSVLSGSFLTVSTDCTIENISDRGVAIVDSTVYLDFISILNTASALSCVRGEATLVSLNATKNSTSTDDMITISGASKVVGAVWDITTTTSAGTTYGLWMLGGSTLSLGVLLLSANASKETAGIYLQDSTLRGLEILDLTNFVTGLHLARNSTVSETKQITVSNASTAVKLESASNLQASDLQLDQNSNSISLWAIDSEVDVAAAVLEGRDGNKALQVTRSNVKLGTATITGTGESPYIAVRVEQASHLQIGGGAITNSITSLDMQTQSIIQCRATRSGADDNDGTCTTLLL